MLRWGNWRVYSLSESFLNCFCGIVTALCCIVMLLIKLVNAWYARILYVNENDCLTQRTRMKFPGIFNECFVLIRNFLVSYYSNVVSRNFINFIATISTKKFKIFINKFSQKKTHFTKSDNFLYILLALHMSEKGMMMFASSTVFLCTHVSVHIS